MAQVVKQIASRKDVSAAVMAFKEIHAGKVYPEQIGPANELLLKPITAPLSFLVPGFRLSVSFEKNETGLVCQGRSKGNGILIWLFLAVVYLLTFPLSIVLIIPVILLDLKMKKHFEQLLSEFKTNFEMQPEVQPQTQQSNKYEQLEKLATLKEKGHLSEEEFEKEKKKLFDF